MAGINTRLKQPIQSTDGFISPVSSIGHAAVIACGPWIFTVIALALVGTTTAQQVSQSVAEGFRLITIYAFAISLVASAPVVLTVTRLIGDAIYLKKYGRIKPLFLAALALATGTSAMSSLLIFAFFFKLPTGLWVAGTSCCGIVAMIWVGLALCGVLRDYRGITLGFVAGLCVAVVSAAWGAYTGTGIACMVWGFDAGLLLVFCGLAGRILVSFSQSSGPLVAPIRILWLGMQQLWRLALGGLLLAVGIWLDKVLVWAGPFGQVHEFGLIHAPLYDSAMFTAYLAIIPALSLFVTHVETVFFPAYRRFYDAIRNHATLRQIESTASALEQTTMQSITHIIVIQAALCLIAVALAPAIVAAAGLQYQQVGILRLGVLGALFQFTFLSTTSLLLFFDRQFDFLFLQGLFLVLQGIFTSASVHFGATYYGLGNLVNCVICGLLAFIALERTVRNLVPITFISSSSCKPSSLDEELSNWDHNRHSLAIKE